MLELEAGSVFTTVFYSLLDSIFDRYSTFKRQNNRTVIDWAAIESNLRGDLSSRKKPTLEESFSEIFFEVVGSLFFREERNPFALYCPENIGNSGNSGSGDNLHFSHSMFLSVRELCISVDFARFICPPFLELLGQLFPSLGSASFIF